MQAPPTLLTLLDPCGGTGTIPTVAAAMMTSVPQVETATSVSDRVSATTHASSAGTRAPTVFAITSEIENVDAGLDSMVQFPTDVVRANAVTLPLRPGCVDVVISDLPFGLKCLKRKALDKYVRPHRVGRVKFMRSCPHLFQCSCGNASEMR